MCNKILLYYHFFFKIENTTKKFWWGNFVLVLVFVGGRGGGLKIPPTEKKPKYLQVRTRSRDAVYIKNAHKTVKKARLICETAFARVILRA